MSELGFTIEERGEVACVVYSDGSVHPANADEVALWQDRRAFLSAFKVWKDATEKRCRLLSSREASDSMLFPDRAFIYAVEAIAQPPEEKG